jgi:hypothetical protein
MTVGKKHALDARNEQHNFAYFILHVSFNIYSHALEVTGFQLYRLQSLWQYLAKFTVA